MWYQLVFTTVDKTPLEGGVTAKGLGALYSTRTQKQKV